jgi:hypothetical protein
MTIRQRFGSSEVREAWAKWLKDARKRWKEEDCWFVTLSFGKNKPYDEAEKLRSRFIGWIERSHCLQSPITAFYIDPKGPMGNRHYHLLMMAEGLGGVNKEQWEKRWGHLAGHGSSCQISQANEMRINYMCNIQNFGAGEIQVRGWLPKAS